MITNPFVLTPKEYTRDLNILKHFVTDAATYLNVMTGRNYDECISFVKNSLRPGGEFEFKDPRIMYLERSENGDREQKEGTLLEYINTAIKERDLIAPTLTLYTNPDKIQSPLVTFIDDNVKARGVAKKAQFAAKRDGNKAVETIKKIEQTNKKLNNNSISGAHVSASTPLYNKTAHSTLTSTCRTTSGYGNANNEKFLCGNRHYWSPDIVRNNIISIINNTDYRQLESAMVQYGIRHPSIEETIECYKYSSDLYWKGVKDHKRLRMLISNLTPIQRSAFVYTGDLYHLMKYNEVVVRTFIDKLTLRADNIYSALNEESLKIAKEIVANSSEDNRNLVSQICSEELKGTSVLKLEGSQEYGIYVATLLNVEETLTEYFNMIRALWVTPNIPASVAVFPDSIRRAAIVSDTDSTIFTVQDWVVWHHGKLGFGQKEDATAAVLIFLASQSITHVLARMSANFGIEEKRLHQITMKNEFKFPIFSTTSVAKHYYALISCQEGNIFKEIEKEIKGVHLKSSNAPKKIIQEATKMMEFILNSTMEGKMISINYILKQIADIEREVIASITRGDTEYFKLNQIKTQDSYKDGVDANAYQQYLLWQEVFAPKYGDTPPPPYTGLKVGVDIGTPTKTREWLDSIEDKELVYRLENWLLKKKSKSFGGTFILPEQCISTKGIPTEIQQAIGIRKIVKDTTNIFYILLESLGIFIINSKLTRLAVDHH